MMENGDQACKFIIIGQILLIACCIFYLIWWSISYRPGVDVDREGGINGALLGITGLCGLFGIAISIKGARNIPKDIHLKFGGWQVFAAWIVLYIIFFLITHVISKRQVTTELLLITGWGVFECFIAEVLKSIGKISGGQLKGLLLIIAAVFLVSMVLYVLYYRMESMKAFYLAMAPLITEAVSMTVVTGTAIF